MAEVEGPSAGAGASAEEVAASSSSLVVNVETKGGHTVDALGKRAWFVKREIQSQESSFEQEVSQIVDRFVCLVLLDLSLELLNNGVARIQLEGLL
jgi:hypothetical protein